MVVASGRNDRHVAAIAEQLREKLKARGEARIRVEGLSACDWVLIDTAMSSSTFFARGSRVLQSRKDVAGGDSARRHRAATARSTRGEQRILLGAASHRRYETAAMRILILARRQVEGRRGTGDERTLRQALQRRSEGDGLGPVEIRELAESRAAISDERKRDEAARLMKDVTADSFVIALDPGGRSISSEAFAEIFLVESATAASRHAPFLVAARRVMVSMRSNLRS